MATDASGASAVVDVPATWLVDYQAVLGGAPPADLEAVIGFLTEELPYCWCDAYRVMTPRPTYISQIRCESFDYIFDDLQTLEALGEVPTSATAESRLVAVLGRSAPRPRSRTRDDRRLRGFIGATEAEFGSAWDKGHFIAHEIGGKVDGMEANVFIQRRDLNRGRSAAGKAYRAMERYCRGHPGSFCFSRPLYLDETSKPSFVEFGILRGLSDLWVQIFDNRGRTVRDEMPGGSVQPA
jgi:hypothetical protein